MVDVDVDVEELVVVEVLEDEVVVVVEFAAKIAVALPLVWIIRE